MSLAPAVELGAGADARFARAAQRPVMRRRERIGAEKGDGRFQAGAGKRTSFGDPTWPLLAFATFSASRASSQESSS